jgi:ATP-dependent exoDNAse (exonuclease V) alpha subunit
MNCSEQQLSPQQVEALASVTSWVDRGRDGTSVFLLCGSAGTGKTTLVSTLVGKLMAKKRSFALLAPTGRAARILGNRAGQLASTIHAAIYSLEDVEVFELAESRNDPGMRVYFRLKTDDPGETLFIVDEASMVADVETEQDLLRFGSGRLLKDLIAFTRIARPGRTGSGAKLMFVGDPAQLPPVGQTLSPALSRDYLQKMFGLMCVGFELTEVIRQKAGSAILN